jgi:hypothetical protein
MRGRGESRGLSHSAWFRYLWDLTEPLEPIGSRKNPKQGKDETYEHQRFVEMPWRWCVTCRGLEWSKRPKRVVLLPVFLPRPGPGLLGGGEADCPQHCGSCHVFLGNPLTGDGNDYVLSYIADDPDCENAVTQQWCEFYDYLAI